MPEPECGMAYTLDLKSVQAPLKERYRSDPGSALVVTAARSASSDLSDPRRFAVAPSEFPRATIRAGLHPAAGGAGDAPCSGDILASALAIVRIHWDFRGTMGVDRDVPVGATGIDMRTRVKVKDSVNPERAKRFLSSAERYCSTLQTLWNGVEVSTEFALE
jgi:hypothetical protein